MMRYGLEQQFESFAKDFHDTRIRSALFTGELVKKEGGNKIIRSNAS